MHRVLWICRNSFTGMDVLLQVLLAKAMEGQPLTPILQDPLHPNMGA